MLYLGQCHCGAISYDYRTAVAPADWPLRACQCSFCRSHGACMTSDPAGAVEFTAKDPTQLQPYRFGRKIADFLICKTCGVYLGATMRTARGSFAIINVNLLRPRPDGLRAAQPMVYDAEDAEATIRRREKVWTPCHDV